MCSSLSQGKYTLCPHSRRYRLCAGTSTALGCQHPWCMAQSLPEERKAHASCTVAHAAHARAVPRRAATLCLSHSRHRGLQITTWWALLKQSMVSASSCTAGICRSYNHPHSWHHFCLLIEAGPVEATALGGSSGNTWSAFWFATSLEITGECMSRAACMHQQARREQTPDTRIRNDVAGQFFPSSSQPQRAGPAMAHHIYGRVKFLSLQVKTHATFKSHWSVSWSKTLGQHFSSLWEIHWEKPCTKSHTEMPTDDDADTGICPWSQRAPGWLFLWVRLLTCISMCGKGPLAGAT